MTSSEGVGSRGQGRSGRPRRAREELEIRAADGWSLRTDVHEPAQAAVGVVVLAHAFMARRSEFDRPSGAGLAGFFVDRGWRVVTFDFRGHGDSGPSARAGAQFGYDELVAGDVAVVYDFARSRSRRQQPVLLVGHSLGGHTAFAAQGAGLARFDGIVGVGASVWLPALEPSLARWLLKRAVLRAMAETSRRLGRLPARALRLGSDDEPARHIEDLERFAAFGAWMSADGQRDYWAGLERIDVPILQLVSDGDRLACPPVCGERFVAPCRGPCRVERLRDADDGGPPLDHMELVTSPRARRAWTRVEAWMRHVRRVG